MRSFLKKGKLLFPAADNAGKKREKKLEEKKNSPSNSPVAYTASMSALAVRLDHGSPGEVRSCLRTTSGLVYPEPPGGT